MAGQGGASLVVWSADGEAPWRRAAVGGSVALQGAQVLSAAGAQAQPESAARAVVLRPVRGVAGVLGVLFVRPETSSQVTLNGIVVSEGLHVVNHGDCIGVGVHAFWVSAETNVEKAAYDPATHGDDVFCFLTKARIADGQAIKICPGVPGTACGAIYKAEAWDMATSADPPIRCANCGYLPGDGEWQPPEPKTRKRLDDLLRFANAGSGN
jgi:hypothetical protein